MFAPVPQPRVWLSPQHSRGDLDAAVLDRARAFGIGAARPTWESLPCEEQRGEQYDENYRRAIENLVPFLHCETSVQMSIGSVAPSL
jgi:hypothetical protein